MNYPISAVLLIASLGLAACQKPTEVLVPVPVAVPGPAGATGATGATGASGTPGEGTTVVVTPPMPAAAPASAASN